MVKKKSVIDDYKYMILVAGGSFLVALVLVAAVAQPLYSSMQKTSAELKEQRSVLAKLESNLKTLKELESKKSEILLQNEKVLAALPKDNDVARLFVQLEKIATTAGLRIASVAEEGQPQEGSGPVSKVQYRVTGSAEDYSAVKKAMINIEKALRIVSVSGLDVQGNATDLSFSFIIDTYERGE